MPARIAAAAGSGDAAMGVIMAGQQAALGKYLAFSRGQEASADAAGAQYLSKAGLSGRGSLAFFKRLQNLEMRYGFRRNADTEFYSTHPMTSDRITTLQDTYEKDPAWNAPVDPQIEARFQRVKAKLFGYLSEPQRTLQVYPESMTGVPARYARAYAWHRQAFPEKALAEAAECSRLQEQFTQDALAAERDWNEIELTDIAARAEVSLLQLRDEQSAEDVVQDTMLPALTASIDAVPNTTLQLVGF